MSTRVILLAAALATLVGCGGDAVVGIDDHAEVASPVLGGATSGPSHDASVLITYNYGPGAFLLCSGVLVAPNVLATARHCIVEYDDSPYSCALNGDTIPLPGGNGGTITDLQDPTNILVFFGNDPDDFHNLADPVPAARGVVVFDDGSTTLCGRDIAFVLLDREVSNAPPIPVRLEPPEVGELVTVIGWGQTEPGPSFKVERHFLTGVDITEVTPQEPDPNVIGVGLPPRSFATGPAVCEGDSGAPALDELGALTGIAAGYLAQGGEIGSAVCSDATSMYTQVSPFRPILEEAMAAAEQPLWIAGEPMPGSVEEDGDCVRNANCASDLCLLDGESDVGRCAALCTADSDCREGKLCELETEVGGYCAPASEVRGDSGGCAIADRRGSRRGEWPGLVLLAGSLLVARRRSSLKTCRSGQLVAAGFRGVRCD